LEQGIQNARLAAEGKLGVVRLGFVSTAGQSLIPELINQYRAKNPLVEFSLRNILTADQGPMLEEGSLDHRSRYIAPEERNLYRQRQIIRD